MSNEIRNQETRAEFYGGKSLAKYIKVHGVPRSKNTFRAMVASSSSEDLDGKKGIELSACPEQVTFFTHPQQVSIMDKGSCKTRASIAR